MKRTILAAVFCSIFIVGACATNGTEQQTQKEGKQKEEAYAVQRMQKADEAEAIAGQVEGVENARAVILDDQLSLAIQVRNFQRLRLDELRRETHQKLRKAFPEYQVRVSSDQKIWREIGKLKEKMGEETYQPLQMKKQLQKINEDMKG